MLTSNQSCVLFTRPAAHAFKNPTKIRLFDCCSDPAETRRLLEEQFLTERGYMLRKYGFDIATGRLVSFCAAEKEDAETDTAAVTGSHNTQNSFLVSAGTNEEVAKPCIMESEVRHRSERYSPYNRQMRITDFFRSRRSINETKMEKTSDALTTLIK